MLRKNNWPVEEQARFLKRTGELLSRGYPLAEALESMSFYLSSHRKTEIRKCLDQLKEGYPLSQIVADLKFNRDLVSYIYFAETHGGLAEAIVEGSNLVLKRENDMKKMLRLASYPLFLIIFTGVLLFFVDEVLLPKFMSLFKNMNLEPNFFTSVVISASAATPIIFSAILCLCAASFVYYTVVFKRFHPLIQRQKLVKLPVVGKLLRLLYTHFFSIQLSYLFSGGLSVYDALKVFEKNRNVPFAAALGTEINRTLAAGQQLDYIISTFPFFEEEFCRIVKHGQENGKLDQELYFYSRHCLSQLEERTEKGIKILQPALYSFIAVMIISLYLAILLPMFRLMDGI
ncbi:competence type IV pilus assembly protein ComGB [Bacillus sp. T33-2]|uniref:competence type IV pilus assembly protein ComGB n=1 Tax=Bacillus sp. T33-2 TaxID=2054168 RepID=UPI000C790730|nr:competence type IV pilus assembly protein ComGB [Bacillus sp. T33-2]PLR99927.1 competence protein ComG [Bacillus sp. T33-2]